MIAAACGGGRTTATATSDVVIDVRRGAVDASSDPVVDEAAAADAGPDGADVVAPPPDGFVDVAAAIPDAILDIRYATANNLTGAPLYPVARCWLRVEAGERLVRAAAVLRAQGRRLILWDCYRPASIQRALWARVPDPTFVARPVFSDDGQPIAGSVHSRGGAIDVSLAGADGEPLAMPTDHDAFGPAARGLRATGAARDHLRALRAALATVGFRPIASEWWHFDAAGASAWPLLDVPLR